MMMMMMTRWSWQVLWRCCRYRARSRARPVCRRSCSSTRQQRSPQVQTPTTRSRPRPGRPTTSWCRSSRRPTTVTCFFVVTRKSTNYSSPRVTSSLSRRHPVPLSEGRRLYRSDMFLLHVVECRPFKTHNRHTTTSSTLKRLSVTRMNFYMRYLQPVTCVNLLPGHCSPAVSPVLRALPAAEEPPSDASRTQGDQDSRHRPRLGQPLSFRLFIFCSFT